MKRIKDDRNLCAHPAFVDLNNLFQPTPEVVRTHIVHAILHLLQHPPVQGKSAVERFFADVKSESFPSDFSSIRDFIEHKYLSRAKDTMVRSLIIAVLKVFMFEEPDFERKKLSLIYGLKAMHEIKPDYFEQVLEQELSRIYEGLDDTRRANIFRLLGELPILWNLLDIPIRLQCKEQFLKKLQGDDDSVRQHIYRFDVFSALAVDELNQASVQKFQILNFLSQCAVIGKNPKAEYIDRGITIFEKAGSYSDAEFIGQRVLLPLAQMMSPEHIERILLAVINNPRNQIAPAAGMPRILESFWDSTQPHLDKTLPAWEQVANKVSAVKYSWADYSILLGKIRNKTEA